MGIAGGAIAANADAEKAGAATLALGLPHGVEDAVTDAFEVAVAALAVERCRQRILRAHVFAAAALEDKADLNCILAMLVPVKNRAAGTEVVAGILGADAVHGVLP